jgi:tetratricopeptide (TPR) repeat protein
MLPAPVLQQYVDHEKAARYGACVKLLAVAVPGNLNVLEPANLPNKPLLIETVFQMLVGYLGLSLKNQQVQNAVSLLLQVLEAMPQALRDLHPGHRTVMEAYLYDTALSVAYYVHSDNGLAQKAETFFTQASERYKKLGHTVRFAKCCCRYASFLAVRQHYHEGEYFLQQALNALKSTPPNSLAVVASHNLAVLTGIQNRMPDALVHMRTYQALCKQLPRLSNAWMQPLDNTQWILLKLQDLWPQHQHEHVAREATSGLV